MVLECIQVGTASCFSELRGEFGWAWAGAFRAPQTLLANLNFLSSDLQAKQGEKGGMDEWGFVALLEMEGFCTFPHASNR